MNANLDPLERIELLPTEAEVVADLAFAAAEATDLDPSIPQALLVPLRGRVEYPDLSKWRTTPVRKTGVYHPGTVEALLDYVEAHQIANQTSVWVHATSGRVEALIDDNGDVPGYAQHRAVLQLTHTPEWAYWLAKDGKLMGQVEFAEHIEGGLQEIEQPDAADVLEIAQSFHAKTNVTFRSSTRLTTGEQQLQYDEEIAAKAGHTGQLTVPTTIVLLLAPFIGEEDVQLTARFRFRLQNGNLALGYKIERPERVIRDALDKVTDLIDARIPRTYIGEAPPLA